MTEGLEPKPESIEHKGKKVFTVCGCEATVVITPDGKRHFEATCPSKEARDELASVFEEEAILRVKPPPPVVEPEPEPPPEE